MSPRGRRDLLLGGLLLIAVALAIVGALSA